MNASRPLAVGLVVETVSADELYQVMSGAASQDPALFQTSSARLKQMLDMFGIYDALHEIAGRKHVPLQIRQQSIIQFKNAALPHWRSRKVLSDDQRIRIRSRCFTFLDEQDETAQCNAVIVSKIARQDYPNNWPDLIDDLMKVIDSTLQKRFAFPNDEDPQDVLILRRSLKLLNGVLKEFSNAKMLNSIRTMGTILQKCQVALYGYYYTLASPYMTTTNSQIISPRACTDILLAHLVYKCIVKMAVWLWNRIDKGGKDGVDAEASQRWIETLVTNSADLLRALVTQRRDTVLAFGTTGLAANPYAQRCVDLLTRHIRLLGKFFRRLQELSSPRFTALSSCPLLVKYYWEEVVAATEQPGLIADSPEAVYPVRFLVQGMVLFKENLGQWKPVRKDGTENQNSLPREFVANAVRTLITQFMPLKEAELQDWMDDPEQWVNDEDKDNEQWIFEIRPCSERVLMQLSNHYPDVVAPLLLDFYMSDANKPATNLQEIIQKEALYCALGRCATKLKDALPFDQWLQTTLTAEAQSTNPIYPIIKRRIAWLLGKWVSDSCASPVNVILWQVLIHLLRDRGPGTDAVVRLTAAIALRECIDTLEFDINVFTPYLPMAVSELVRLLGEADTLEMKRRVDYTLNVVIEQSGERISDFVNIITEPLPGLWTAAGEDWLFKGSLLVTVTKLVGAIGERSASLTNIVVPLVREGLSPGIAASLDEDAMDLWLAALRNGTSIQSAGSPALIEIFPLAMSLLAMNLDLLGKAINIIDSYFLLNSSLILQTFAIDLFSAFRAALSSAAVQVNLKDMLNSLNLLVQVAPSTLWGEAMHVSGLFVLLMKNIVEGECGAILLTEHIYLMSRIVLADRQMFLQLMTATSTPALDESKLYEHLLDRWWGTWDNMSEPRHRKLAAMGIAALVSTARPDVLQRVPGDIFNIWTDVLLELKEAQLNAVAAADEAGEPVPSPLNLQRHWELDEAPPAYYQSTEGTSEYNRRKAVYDRDPVRTMQLTAYIAAHLREAEAACGPQVFQDTYLSQADPAVLAMIQNQLSRG
ncbi:armadillo-type protein [Mycena sp. CBHHK59/15]|nr:armadillo-type protein [Mycena sp. CBHHK59/15]